MTRVTYLLPIRAATGPSEELTSYLAGLARACRVLIVDGSADDVFAAAHEAWSPFADHIRPAPALRCANGKVWGVLTGLELVDTELVVIADDDVRYSGAALDSLVRALERADVVVPQNHFVPLPWHARWDTARTLLNRISGGDFPGTLGVRVETLRRAGGYDGDVLFENLELMRTIEAVGGTVHRDAGLYVRRVPPTTRHFLSQRVRQAYDEMARPARLVAQLAIAPCVAAAAMKRPRAIAAGAALAVGVAEVGRRRAGGRRIFPVSSSLLAPLWLVERGVCVWLALLQRVRGGVPYSSTRIARAATSPRVLRRRHAAARAGCQAATPT